MKLLSNKVIGKTKETKEKLPGSDRARLLLNFRASSKQLAMLVSLLFVLVFNKSFFSAAWQTIQLDSVGAILFLMSLVPLLWLLTFIFFYLFCLPIIIKPLCVFLLICGAFSAYFMDTYSVIIDEEMLRNVLETDSKESMGLLSVKLILYVIVIGILPSWMIVKVKVVWGNPWREIISRSLIAIIILVMAILIILSLSAYYSSFFRNHKEVRFLTNPLGFLNAGISLVRDEKLKPLIIESISQGAVLNNRNLKQSKPMLVVLVIGEAARAANFGLDGYKRNTTPLTAQQDIIYFNEFSSCGTSTAVSLPCMFSTLSRKDYKNEIAKSRHGLLDFIQNAGVDVLWRENNSGCKGVCDRVSIETFKDAPALQWCKDGGCYDEVLLHDLAGKISGRNQVIVLHQNGSHGPEYDKRYPDSMRFYTPVCKTNQLQSCSHEELINAYDNTIRYTDYFLNKTIKWLIEQENTHDVAMIYVSDHGESLGENRIYLHGIPYAIAPEYQTLIPFIFWASSDFYSDRKLDKSCLYENRKNPFSHDNLFHSLLGLIDIKTEYYQPKMDIFAPCITTVK
jgi:lipid A ethanolaminephosphotransferase